MPGKKGLPLNGFNSCGQKPAQVLKRTGGAARGLGYGAPIPCSNRAEHSYCRVHQTAALPQNVEAKACDLQVLAWDARSFLAKHENDPRYLLNPKLIAKERARAERASNVSSCTRLEASLDQFDPAAANRHLRRLGCLLFPGNSETRAAVANYRDFLDQVGYTKIGVPRGGTLWFKGEAGFRFHMHRLVQKQFYEMCRLYLGSDILLSSAGTTASIRTVAPSKGGLVPFHQDISPVDIQRALTFREAIDPDGIGQDAPGLRFIASTKTRRTKIMLRDVSSHELIGPGLRSNEFFWTPKIDAGDVMIFDP